MASQQKAFFFFDQQLRQTENRALWTVQTHEGPAEIKVRHDARARRVSLQVDPRTAGIVLTLPRRASISEGKSFVFENLHWIGRQLAALPPGTPFAAGAVVPLLGRDLAIRAWPGLRGPTGLGPVWQQDGILHVAGDPRHHGRRIKDWLVGQARTELSGRVIKVAGQLDRSVSRVVIRDTRSRWGSCSRQGVMSFSWRLVMAPEPVVDYIAVHEACHLRYMSHGPRFWQLVERLDPDYESAEEWLRVHGPGLHRYGWSR